MTENDYMIKDLGEEELLDLAELFKMFADSTRIKILYDLFDGEKNVSEICEDIQMNQSAVSHQLIALVLEKFMTSDRSLQSPLQGCQHHSGRVDIHSFHKAPP